MLKKRTIHVATLLFFASGALGLGYELVWIRKAALVVGASQIALSTVLTSFFLGLALGSYVVSHHLRSRRWSPLRVYGVFEVMIGIFALAFPFLFDALEAAYASLYPLVMGSSFALFAVRFLLLFLLCLVPTFFMGGTLPLLLDGLIAEDRTIGSRASFLYGINILGAVLGVLATCYFGIPILGLNGTSVAGGAGNLLIGGAAIAMFRRVEPLHADAERAPLEGLYPCLAFLSGLISISYQICWVRYFTLFQTTTIYITAILLAVFLLALAAGSLLLSPLLSARWNPLRIVAWVQVFVPLATLYTLRWWRGADYRVALRGELAPDGSIAVKDSLEIDPQYADYWFFFSEKLDATFFAPLFQVALVIFVPVVLLGMGLPSLIAAAARRASGVRSVSGRMVFWNMLGSSAGGFLGGYVLLPALGLHGSLVLLGVLSLSFSLTAGWKASSLDASLAAKLSRREKRQAARHRETPERAPRRVPFAYLAAAVASLAGIAYFALGREDVTRQTIREDGYGRDPGARSLKLVEVLEGPLTSSFVFEDASSLQIGSGHVSLAVVYKDEPSTQAIQGHIPVLFYPGNESPRDCLGICLGSGQSFGALLLYRIRKLDVVDISPEIIDLSLRTYREYNHGLDRDDRVSFHLDDGRHFVDRAPDSSYDLVSMEPPPPTADGVCALYSLEFYRSVRRILRPTGVFMQWLPLYRITPLDAKGIVKTQAAVFPESFVVKVGKDDFMIVSYAQRPVFLLPAMAERCRIFETERLVKGTRWAPRCLHDIASLEGVISLLITGPREIEAIQDAMIYRDDTQRLSYSSGDRELHRLYEGPMLSRLTFPALSLTSFSDLKTYFEPALSEEQISDLTIERAASLAFFRVPDPREVLADLNAYRASPSKEERSARALSLARAFDGPGYKRTAYEWIRNALEAHSRENRPEQIEIARSIVRSGVAVYADIAQEWIDTLRRSYPGAPIVAAMRQELEQYRIREEAIEKRYLFP
ncbi:MAG: hypothetical protein JXA90_07600 [Planctomycetes bacterium]|nr:hypothetical protein [Planctomycetota bacterium]